MDEMMNEEPQAVEEQTPRRRRVEKKAAFPIPLPAFLSGIGKDVRWYYDVRLWSPLILLLLLLAIIPNGQTKAEPVETTPQTVPVVQTEAKETEPPTEPLDPNADALAKLAESVGAGRSDNVKEIIMWVAINRVEDRSNGYGLTLEEEIARPNQWQGYNENVVYNEETYEIAKDVLETVAKHGLRPLDNDMLWFVLNDNGSITVRNRFTAGANQKWVEKTIK